MDNPCKSHLIYEIAKSAIRNHQRSTSHPMELILGGGRIQTNRIESSWSTIVRFFIYEMLIAIHGTGDWMLNNHQKSEWDPRSQELLDG